MAYRRYDAADRLLIGYDPFDLPEDHLVRLVELITEEVVNLDSKPVGPGQPRFDPRLPVKVLVYGYAIGLRSSRQLEKACRETLPFLLLTRGDCPSYRTLCSARVKYEQLIEEVWIHLFSTAEQMGIKRLGRIVVDSTKLRADASDESVVVAHEMQTMLDHIQQILNEASEADVREDAEGYAGETLTGKLIDGDQLRDIMRNVRKKISKMRAEKQAGGAPTTGSEAPMAVKNEAPSAAKDEPQRKFKISSRMRKRLNEVCLALADAIKSGTKHLCTTDFDAKMMGEGRHKRIAMCHSYEVAADNGLLVAFGTSDSANDNPRLFGLVERAAAHEPSGVQSVDADSGYYSGRSVSTLSLADIDVCIPTTSTACDMRKGLDIGTTVAKGASKVNMTYVPDADHYVCPEGKILAFEQLRTDRGVDARVYRAPSGCRRCSLASTCLTQKNADHRTLVVPIENELLTRLQDKFGDTEHCDRYHHRAEAVETVFGFVRATLGFTRWSLRGSQRVAAESKLITVAYQVRKIHSAIVENKNKGIRIALPASAT